MCHHYDAVFLSLSEGQPHTLCPFLQCPVRGRIFAFLLIPILRDMAEVEAPLRELYFKSRDVRTAIARPGVCFLEIWIKL